MTARPALLAALLAGSMLAASPSTEAYACVPALPDPLLPGETPGAWQARQQARRDASIAQGQRELWARADRVFLARVSEPEPEPLPAPRRYPPRRGGPPPLIPPPPFIRLIDPFSGKRTMVLTPFVALKGASPARAFEIVDSWSSTSCGPYWRFNAGGAPPGLIDGELMVVFATGPYPTEDGILEVLAIDQVLDPGIKAAIAAAR